MDILIIHATDDSPEVLFDKEKNTFVISGKSLPEDVATFYAPVLEWLNKYARNPSEETTISFKYTYFNTASSKIILDILLILEGIKEKGHKISVHWFYPEYDEDMHEAGIEYSEMVEIDFEFTPFLP